MPFSVDTLPGVFEKEPNDAAGKAQSVTLPVVVNGRIERPGDYRVPIGRLLQERKEEARLMPGLDRTDEPVFNIPALGKNHLRAWQHHDLISLTPRGERIYEFHPWEKNIAVASTYVHRDVPIADFLAVLAERGEDLDQYRSIWYYF